jgi:8-oxo-dGTP diphosphatase
VHEPVIALQLVPEEFTLTELQRVHERILGIELDKRNFRKKTLALDLLEPTGEERRDGPHRPARLYRAKNPTDVPYR